jgi:hypothetical protein
VWRKGAYDLLSLKYRGRGFKFFWGYEYVFIRTENLTPVVMKSSTFLVISWFFLTLKMEGACFSRNVCWFSTDYTMLYPSRQHSSVFSFLVNFIYGLLTGTVHSLDYTEPDCRVAANKKFWKELIAYISLILHGTHKTLRLHQFFVTAGKSLLSSYLATIRGYTDHQIDAPKISSMVARIVCHGIVWPKPLPINEGKDTL